MSYFFFLINGSRKWYLQNIIISLIISLPLGKSFELMMVIRGGMKKIIIQCIKNSIAGLIHIEIISMMFFGIEYSRIINTMATRSIPATFAGKLKLIAYLIYALNVLLFNKRFC